MCMRWLACLLLMWLDMPLCLCTCTCADVGGMCVYVARTATFLTHTLFSLVVRSHIITIEYSSDQWSSIAISGMSRLEETRTLQPAKVIMFEGILSLYTKDLRDKFDMKLFVDCDSDERLARRGR